jgi:mannose-6-phosphate isomerase-like protein (cupin superfamily)
LETTPFAQTVEKPWGYEVRFTPSDRPYAGKLLHVFAGHRLSLQYHDRKWETILLLSGKAILVIEGSHGLETVAMEPYKGYSIVPGQRHRIIAVDACAIVESSTPELGTTYRLEDDTGRADETEAERHVPRAAGSR